MVAVQLVNGLLVVSSCWLLVCFMPVVFLQTLVAIACCTCIIGDCQFMMFMQKTSLEIKM